MIDPSTMHSMREVGRCFDLGYGIGATDKIFSNEKRFFPTQIIGTSLTL